MVLCAHHFVSSRSLLSDSPRVLTPAFLTSDNHVELGLTVELFIRETKKLGGKAAPFSYVGEVEFQTGMVKS